MFCVHGFAINISYNSIKDDLVYYGPLLCKLTEDRHYDMVTSVSFI